MLDIYFLIIYKSRNFITLLNEVLKNMNYESTKVEIL